MRQLYGPDGDRACHAEEPAVDEWEAGVRYPTWEQLQALAELTRFPVAFFTPDPDKIQPLGPGVMFVCRRSSRNHNPVVEIPEPVLAFTPQAVAATVQGYCVACLERNAAARHTCEQTALF